jgi:hypothetical protein
MLPEHGMDNLPELPLAEVVVLLLFPLLNGKPEQHKPSLGKLLQEMDKDK